MCVCVCVCVFMHLRLIFVHIKVPYRCSVYYSIISHLQTDVVLLCFHSAINTQRPHCGPGLYCFYA